MGARRIVLEYIPIMRTLGVCTDVSKKSARVELYWTVGFALLSVPIVLLIVLFTRPVSELPSRVFQVVGRGELMIYASSICGVALYSLRHGIDAIPDAVKSRITPVGTLTVCTSILLFVAVTSYVVRRTGEINQFYVNDPMLNVVSAIVLVVSLTIAYVVLALKFSLKSGAAPASHEQTEDFGKQWEAERGS